MTSRLRMYRCHLPQAHVSRCRRLAVKVATAVEAPARNAFASTGRTYLGGKKKMTNIAGRSASKVRPIEKL
jgi:hypothetical protein